MNREVRPYEKDLMRYEMVRNGLQVMKEVRGKLSHPDVLEIEDLEYMKEKFLRSFEEAHQDSLNSLKKE